jgi:hypothetical protein
MPGRWKPATRAEMLALQFPPRDAAVKHGMYMEAGRVALCSGCPLRPTQVSATRCPHFRQGEECAVEAAWMAEMPLALEQDLREMRRPIRYSTRLLIEAAVTAFIRWQRGERVSIFGSLQPDRDGRGFEYRKVDGQIKGHQRHFVALLAELGLTPVSEARMVREATSAMEEYAEAMRRAKESEAAKRGVEDAEAIEGEFEVSDEGARAGPAAEGGLVDDADA